MRPERVTEEFAHDSETTLEPATVGVLANAYLSEWEIRALERLRDELDVEFSLVVVDDRSSEEVASQATDRGVRLGDVVRFFDHLKEHRAKSLVLLEREIGRLLGDEHPMQRYHAIEDVDVLSDVELFRCEPRTDGAWAELPDDAVERVAETSDVVVRFGFGLVRGEILTEPEYGVLSFHPADIRKYRGLGTWPTFADGSETAGATLQRLDDSIDSGEIIAYDEIDVSDCDTLWELIERVLEMEIRLLSEGVANLQEPDFEPTEVPESELGEMYFERDREKLGFSGRILLKNLRGRLRRRLR